MVHFSGDWSDADRQSVVKTANEIEDALGGTGLTAFGEPWICTCEVLGGRVFYLAQCLQLRRIIRATSCGELIQKMKQQLLGAA